MTSIQDILQLPKEEQLRILEAIQANLEDSADGNIDLNEDQIEFIKNRVDEIDNGNHKLYSWDEVKQALANKWHI